MMYEDVVLRLDARLASLARNGKTAMLCFYVRGQEQDLAEIAKLGDAALIVGVVAAREVRNADGQLPE